MIGDAGHCMPVWKGRILMTQHQMAQARQKAAEDDKRSLDEDEDEGAKRKKRKGAAKRKDTT